MKERKSRLDEMKGKKPRMTGHRREGREITKVRACMVCQRVYKGTGRTHGKGPYENPYWHMKMAVPIEPWLSPTHPVVHPNRGPSKSWFIGMVCEYLSAIGREGSSWMTLWLWPYVNGGSPPFFFLPGPPPTALSLCPLILFVFPSRRKINFLPASRTVISQMTRPWMGTRLNTRRKELLAGPSGSKTKDDAMLKLERDNKAIEERGVKGRKGRTEGPWVCMYVCVFTLTSFSRFALDPFLTLGAIVFLPLPLFLLTPHWLCSITHTYCDSVTSFSTSLVPHFFLQLAPISFFVSMGHEPSLHGCHKNKD